MAEFTSDQSLKADATEARLSELSESAPGERPAQERRRWSKTTRALFSFAGILVPILCFVSAAPQGAFLITPWQSGHLNVYASLLLKLQPAAPFYPLLVYSMTGLALLVFAPERFAPKFWARWGVYSGVLLASHFWCLIGLRWAGDAPLINLKAVAAFGGWMFASALAVGLPLSVIGFLYWLCGRWSVFRVWATLVCLAILALAGAIIYGTDISEVPPAMLGLSWGACLIFGTPWAVGAYGAMAGYLLRRPGARRNWSLSRLFGVFTWIAAYCGAWRIAITQMLEEYAKLPTAPGCYIATAAARGHRRFVGARLYFAADGRRFAVNDQLCRLKCFELILAHCLPRAHRVCRGAYDRLGPPAAALLAHPLLADAAYLLLKPAEWASLALLTTLGQQGREAARRIYGEEAVGR